MKKIALALLIMAILVPCTFASDGVNIFWNTWYGGFTHDAAVLTGVNNLLLDNYSVTWQLLYSVDSVADSIDLSNAAGGWVSGDDVVWGTRTLAQSIALGDVTAPEDGTVWDNSLYLQSGDTGYANTLWTTAGYVFQRVYEGAPSELSWVYETTPEALVINPPIAQTMYLDTPDAGFQPDQQIPAAVPEPATMALLGLGALTMAIRRRRS